MTDEPKVEPSTTEAGIRTALEEIRGDVARQLRQLGRAAGPDDIARLPRFSSALPHELPPERVSELERAIAELEPWLQGPFVLADNLVIPGTWRNDQRWESLSEHVPDVTGRRVLDVGSNAGYDPFMFHLLGAREVMACEPFAFIHQARFLESIYGTGVNFREIGWQALDPTVDGPFDLVHCNGVLYHEPDPLGMLLRLRSMLADDAVMLFGSMVHAGAEQSEYIRFVPDAYAGDRTWWFVPGRLAMRWMLEVAGFRVDELLVSEGPRGDFPTYNMYFRARCAPVVSELAGQPATLESPGAAARFEPGHYYSPMYDVGELRERRAELWPSTPRATPDIDWRDASQVELCERVFESQRPLEFDPEEPSDPSEYWGLNSQYPPLDAWVLAGLLRELRPSSMIEIGSGYSSLVTARVNREDLGGAMSFVCIEPHPRDFLRDGVEGISDLRIEKVQDTPLEIFEELGAGDVLFVDTSHTVKTGGDVVWIFHEIVPRLAPGVYVHVHDVFLPGEYPEPWVLEGWGWNEGYLVRSFLSFNDTFEVVWGSQYMTQRHPDAIMRAFPEQARYTDRAGAALWMRRKT